MKILTPKKIGCCFGVTRAVKLTEEALSRGVPAYINGELVHNDTITRKLSEKGLTEIRSMNEVKSGMLIIRAHGISPDERAKVDERKIEIVDATCPIVRQAQVSAKKLEEEGYQVIIVGDRSHAEIKGILGHLKNEALVVANHKDIDHARLKNKVGLIFQTTHSIELCREVVAEVMKVSHEIKIINTICADIRKRQEDAVKLAQKTGLMIVVGSHHSSNTIKLKKLCLKYNDNTMQIERARDLDPKRFKGIRSVGIIGGASTPDILIEEVKKRLRSINRK